MTLYKLTIAGCTAGAVEAISLFLEEQNSVSITLCDAKDCAILEPLPGTTPYWPESVIEALFTSKAQAQAALQYLQAQYPFADTIVTQVAEKDWTAIWMQEAKPLCFGEHLWVCPTFCAPPEDKPYVQLDPGLAFGTGTHPTTALCLNWLAANPPQNKNVIDYGCGSGILALAAVKLGARLVYAVDIDNQALEATRNNSVLNNIDAHTLKTCTPETVTGPVEIVIANILLNPLLQLQDTFVSLLAPQGYLVVSGIFSTQSTPLQEAYAQNFVLISRVEQEDWALLVFKKITP